MRRQRAAHNTHGIVQSSFLNILQSRGPKGYVEVVHRVESGGKDLGRARVLRGELLAMAAVKLLEYQ